MSDLFEICSEMCRLQLEVAQANDRIEKKNLRDFCGYMSLEVIPAEIERHDSDAEDFKRESKQLKEDNPIILPTDINPPDWQELQAEDEKDWSNNFKCRSCGEKFADEFASDDDVALCKWCNGEEE